MELPLLERAQAGDDAFLLTTAANPAGEVVASLCGIGSSIALPHPPGPGEQYRFHFDMTKCIGCKCCVVACNEQNGNPADILWRRVGEIEGGIYPDTLRHYLSMGCNHCLEPTCMTGCPVDAYSKDGPTGIVRHSADICIGCQYCTWNCSYGVPQYNPERGVVGKCDMCYGRLTQGQNPACVSACPEDAIRIETVRVAEWREEYKIAANSPGMPSADDSLSTTRITLPSRMPRDVRKVDLNRLRPEEPHWPLVVDDGSYATLRRCVRFHLVAAGFQRPRASRSGAGCVAGGGCGPLLPPRSISAGRFTPCALSRCGVAPGSAEKCCCSRYLPSRQRRTPRHCGCVCRERCSLAASPFYSESAAWARARAFTWCRGALRGIRRLPSLSST